MRDLGHPLNIRPRHFHLLRWARWPMTSPDGMTGEGGDSQRLNGRAEKFETGQVPQGLKPDILSIVYGTTLKSCPDTKQSFPQPVKLSLETNRGLTKGPQFICTERFTGLPDERLAYSDFLQGRLTVF